MRSERDDGAVGFGARDTAVLVFAGDKAALRIERVPVGLAGWMPEHTELAIFVPVNLAGRDVGEKQFIARRYPDRAFEKLKTTGDFLS